MEAAWIELGNNLVEFLRNPAIVETFVDILVCAVPIWVAVMIGLLIGWSWRPRWTSLVFLGFRSKFRFIWTIPVGIGARRFWFAFTALSVFSVCRTIWLGFRGWSRKSSSLDLKVASASPGMVAASQEFEAVDDVAVENVGFVAEIPDGGFRGVTDKDLERLLHFIEGQDGEMTWQSMMECSTSNMQYQAWCYEPEIGPTVYRSKTIFEDATPEMVRDFFWDDEFRPKWDPMLVHVKILEECPDTGMMIVHWIKKFPFFCSDREYIIGRRIWESGSSSYCVTKAVHYPTLPRCNKPRRVDLYFSSWVINPVESLKGDGQLTACEVTLIHYEDMGIPKDVAKLGVRHGMWGTVKKLHAGFRTYQNARKSETPPTRCALMARITTVLSQTEERDSAEQVTGEEDEDLIIIAPRLAEQNGIDWKWVVIGGTVALLACGLQTGLVGRAMLLGAGHRIGRRRQNSGL